jgi:hypothetical protein
VGMFIGIFTDNIALGIGIGIAIGVIGTVFFSRKKDND